LREARAGKWKPPPFESEDRKRADEWCVLAAPFNGAKGFYESNKRMWIIARNPEDAWVKFRDSKRIDIAARVGKNKWRREKGRFLVVPANYAKRALTGLLGMTTRAVC
jgi:hypothetical protein